MNTVSNYNENGYTKEDLDTLIRRIADDPSDDLCNTFQYTDWNMIIDALEFYKDTHYIG